MKVRQGFVTNSSSSSYVIAVEIDFNAIEPKLIRDMVRAFLNYSAMKTADEFIDFFASDYLWRQRDLLDGIESLDQKADLIREELRKDRENYTLDYFNKALDVYSKGGHLVIVECDYDQDDPKILEIARNAKYGLSIIKDGN